MNRSAAIPEQTFTDPWMKTSINLLFSMYRLDMEFLFPVCCPKTGERDRYEGQFCYKAINKILKSGLSQLDIEKSCEEMQAQYEQKGQRACTYQDRADGTLCQPGKTGPPPHRTNVERC